jgi:hypothetical protein
MTNRTAIAMMIIMIFTAVVFIFRGRRTTSIAKAEIKQHYRWMAMCGIAGFAIISAVTWLIVTKGGTIIVDADISDDAPPLLMSLMIGWIGLVIGAFIGLILTPRKQD